MSINMDMDNMNTGIEYPDFDYQVIEFNTNQDTGSSNSAVVEVEPLEDRGGLASNEVAELVAMRVWLAVETEDEESDYSTTASYEIHGHIGSGLSEAQINGLSGGDGQPGRQFNSGGDDELDGVEYISQTDSGIFDTFRYEFSAGGTKAAHQSTNFRDISMRGPVLDQTDNIEIGARVVASEAPAEFHVRIRCVWDTAELDEAGREFSVP